MMSGYDMTAWGWAMMLSTGVVVLVLVGLLVWLAVARRYDEVSAASPRALLDGRLARGEIDTREHERLRRALASGGRRSDGGGTRPA